MSKFTYQQVSLEFTEIVECLEYEWADDYVDRLKDILSYALDCVAKVQDIKDRNAIDSYVRNKVNG